MTEQEYIWVRDLSNVMIAKHCVRDLNAGHSVMTESERSDMVKILKKWENELFEKAKTKDE